MRYIIRTTLCLLLFFSFLETGVRGHGLSIPVIVDTDMALDDIRAVTMLLNSGMTRIPLIIASDGSNTPQTGARYAAGLLKFFGREDTEVCEGRTLNRPAPPWRTWLMTIPFPEKASSSDRKMSHRRPSKAVAAVLKSSEQGLIYLCLGPLTNLAETLRAHPDIKKKISFIIYFGGHPDDSQPGWNTDMDPESARFVYDSGIEMHTMNLPDDRWMPFNSKLYEEIRVMGTPGARMVSKTHDTPAIAKLLAEDHFHVWDEMTVIYMSNPSLFRFKPGTTLGHVKSLASYDGEEVRTSYLRLLGYSGDFHLGTRPAVVFKEFPRNPLTFMDDVAPFVDQIIERHGYEEWISCLITNELHRHLGIYSIIGAKMGIRAREILEAPFDELKVISHAGNEPPLSCMNDGLQVSTGASLGRGAIEVDGKDPIPSATFLFKGATLKIILKPDKRAGIRADIKGALSRYGGLNPAYYSYIRRLSIGYWRDLDRREIFEESLR